MGRFKDAVASRVKTAGFAGVSFDFSPQAVSETNPFGGDACLLRVDVGDKTRDVLETVFIEYAWSPLTLEN